MQAAVIVLLALFMVGFIVGSFMLLGPPIGAARRGRWDPDRPRRPPCRDHKEERMAAGSDRPLSEMSEDELRAHLPQTETAQFVFGWNLGIVGTDKLTAFDAALKAVAEEQPGTSPPAPDPTDGQLTGTRRRANPPVTPGDVPDVSLVRLATDYQQHWMALEAGSDLTRAERQAHARAGLALRTALLDLFAQDGYSLVFAALRADVTISEIEQSMNLQPDTLKPILANWAAGARHLVYQMPDGEVRKINLTEVAYPEEVTDV